MSTVIHIHSEQEFNDAIKDADFKATIVDFTATWCGPCRMIGPVFESLSTTNKTVKFIKVDVDELEDVSAAANVSAMPTFQVYKNGVKQDELVGASKADLETLVKKFA